MKYTHLKDEFDHETFEVTENYLLTFNKESRQDFLSIARTFGDREAAIIIGSAFLIQVLGIKNPDLISPPQTTK